MANDPNLYGNDLFGDAIQPEARGKLADTFLIPPFSVLNAREGFWQDRKRAWLAMGIKSEVGRGENLIAISHSPSPGGSPRPAADDCNRQRGAGDGKPLTPGIASNGKSTSNADAKSFGIGGWMADKTGESRGNESGTSVFDPVLCELAYRWFAPPGGLVLDPFAGGSVRGIVAASIGRRYHGIELRAEQVAANRIQAASIMPDAGEGLVWVEGCSRAHLPAAPPADFLFSCPPYGDLETYSNDPRDLSAMGWPAFLESYRAIIAAACARLKPNRFACFVVGDFRCPRGNYRNFVGETIAAFLAAGMELYNEAVLLTCVGSLPIRAKKQFDVSRKLGKTHQNVLVFVKGCPREATKAINAE